MLVNAIGILILCIISLFDKAFSMCWSFLTNVGESYIQKNRLYPTGPTWIFLIGLNDYSSWIPDKEKQPAFDYYSMAEVTSFSGISKGMVIK